MLFRSTTHCLPPSLSTGTRDEQQVEETVLIHQPRQCSVPTIAEPASWLLYRDQGECVSSCEDLTPINEYGRRCRERPCACESAAAYSAAARCERTWRSGHMTRLPPRCATDAPSVHVALCSGRPTGSVPSWCEPMATDGESWCECARCLSVSSPCLMC